MVTGLHPTPWVEEHYGQREMQCAQGTASTSGWRAIAEIDLHSRALSRSDRASDRVSRLNHNTINNHINDNAEDHCSQSI